VAPRLRAARDKHALRLFAEYNLHDVIHLRTLIAYAYNALVDKVQAPAVRARGARRAGATRGDVLYDVSKNPAQPLTRGGFLI